MTPGIALFAVFSVPAGNKAGLQVPIVHNVMGPCGKSIPRYESSLLGSMEGSGDKYGAEPVTQNTVMLSQAGGGGRISSVHARIIVTTIIQTQRINLAQRVVQHIRVPVEALRIRRIVASLIGIG